MFVKELDWGERRMFVRRADRPSSGHVECDGFKATPRELEILRLKAMGLKHKKIAEELTIACHFRNPPSSTKGKEYCGGERRRLAFEYGANRES